MQETILLMIAGLIFLAGLAVGIGVQEHNTAARERRIAEKRREVADRTRALDAYAGVDQVIWKARHRLRRDVVLDVALPLVIDQDDRDDHRDDGYERLGHAS